MPNGMTHCYQLDKSIFVLRDVEWYFSFFSFQILIEHYFAASGKMRRLVCVSTVCLCPTKRTLGLNWLKSTRRISAKIAGNAQVVHFTLLYMYNF